MDGYVAHVAVRRGVYRVLVGKPEGKRPLGRPSHRWGIIFNYIFRNWDGGVECIDVSQNMGRCWNLVNAIMNIRVL